MLLQMGAQLENLVAAGGGLVEGTVQRVTYRSDETGYSVLQVAFLTSCGFSCTGGCCSHAPLIARWSQIS